MFVDERTAELKAEVRGVTYYFCSRSCMDEFLAPEKELRKLKLEVFISALLLLPILIITYASPLSSQVSNYILFLLETPLQFVIGRRFYRGTYEAIKSRMGNMDVLIALGASAAWVYSTIITFAPDVSRFSDVYFDTSAVIITLILAGRLLEHSTKERATAALRSLTRLQPTMAHRLDTSGVETDVPIALVGVGDLLVVKPGERVPVDGVVVDGASAVDESMITGESTPTEKSAGDEVIGATINRSGLLKVRAEKVGQDTALAQIVRLVEEAQIGRAPVQRLADRIASVFVPLVIAAALSAGLSWYLFGHIRPDLAVLVFVSVVVISCPCALGIATPAALLVGTSKGAQNGVLIKSGEYLELAGKVDTVVFDKTGTLTVGKPSVTDIIAAQGFGPDDLLHLAASIERGSEHPLGRAIVEEAKERLVELSEPMDFSAVVGRGVKAMVDGRAVLFGNRSLIEDGGDGRLASLEPDLTRLEDEGKTVMILMVDRKVSGLIAVADTVKPSARAAVDALKRMGILVVMLTGDNSRTAAAVAHQRRR
jgi:P-type Cu+ transporter